MILAHIKISENNEKFLKISKFNALKISDNKVTFNLRC